MSKIVLTFVPQWEPIQPYASLPYLSAFLKHHGYDVVQRDLNVEAYDDLLSPASIHDAGNAIRRRMQEMNRTGCRSEEEKEEQAYLRGAIECCNYAADRIDDAKRILRSSDKLEKDAEYPAAVEIVKKGLEGISGAYYPTRLKLNGFSMRYSPLSVRQLMQAIDDRKENPFLRYFERDVVPSLLKEKPDIVGISIISSGQMIAGLTLARLLKARSADIHITVGGNIFTQLIDEIRDSREIFSVVDSIILFEGETPLLKLAQCIERKTALDDVPNLVSVRNGSVVVNSPYHVEDVNALPPPDFDGLPRHLYFAPRMIMPLFTSRGCYWNKCTFCRRSTFHLGHRRRSIARVVEDIRYLKNRYGTDLFYFTDESISPAKLRELAGEVIQNKLNVRWFSYARFEKGYTAELMSLLARSGCNALWFGLESASQRILDLMGKGTDREVIETTLENCIQAGIAIHLFCMLGFPTESRAESEETLNFILQNEKLVRSAGFYAYFGVFHLDKNSLIHKNPDRYGISKIDDEGEDNFTLSYRFVSENGQTADELREMCNAFRERMHEVVNPLYRLDRDFIGSVYFLDMLVSRPPDSRALPMATHRDPLVGKGGPKGGG